MFDELSDERADASYVGRAGFLLQIVFGSTDQLSLLGLC